jgi:hypothetical protein
MLDQRVVRTLSRRHLRRCSQRRGAAHCLRADLGQRCVVRWGHRVEAGWRYFPFRGLPEVKRLLLLDCLRFSIYR